jgi:arylsulfatase A-like enzyme
MVMLVSKWVGYLIRKLKDLCIYEETVLMFHSDHGIYVGEHDRAGKHSIPIPERDARGHWPLYGEVARVPLLIRTPGAKLGTRRSELVQAVDIMPTLLDLAGLSCEVPFHGHSLVPLLQGEEAVWPREVAFSSEFLRNDPQTDMPWTTLTGRDYTLLVGGRPGTSAELYDRRTDPDQQKNTLKNNLDTASTMAETFLTCLSSIGTEASRIEALRSRLSESGVVHGKAHR